MTSVTATLAPGVVARGTGSDAERILGRIGADLLGLAEVAPGDSFFPIGGDSILTVAIATRAARAGLHVTPHDVLSNPVLREPAAVAVKVPAAPAAPEQPVAAADMEAFADRLVEAFTELAEPAPADADGRR
ncbi:phosphopantetheine-binding protein [Streptomyces sp. P1-3]|uniref:phosphopantetheine-binding protein n=1 Tax=Streptomyces sp. P1-3 TaxID=3421658 RepID=UPI003D35F754